VAVPASGLLLVRCGTALAPLPCVDPDGPWQKLQLHLRSARAARDVGDVTLALQEVDAALSIDPDYLAARFLRESIANPEPAISTMQPSPIRPSPAQVTPPQLEREPQDLAAASAHLSLEERARRRRIEQRTAAARTAILLGRFDEARAALDELVELEPALPAISEIAADLHTARARGRRKRPTLLAAVAAALVGVIVGALAGGATQVHRLVTRADSVPVAPLAGNAMPMFSVSPPVLTATLPAEFVEPAATAAVAPEPIVAVRADPVPPPRAARGVRAGIATPPPIAESVSPAVADRPSPVSVVERPSATPASVERVPEPPPAVSARVERPSDAAPAIAADDPALIRAALQRYRHAYNTLDARLAHATYPGVDEAALTRAFEGLRSQALEFEACSVDALAESARAVCRGSARYVPKIGSREPHAETRVWTFKLKKNDGDWRIESAWTDR
jgi:tetratricopeptide (TPR) repeat protein